MHGHLNVEQVTVFTSELHISFPNQSFLYVGLHMLLWVEMGVQQAYNGRLHGTRRARLASLATL